MIKNNFIFDVDGTLTPSRQCINASFASWFLRFCNVNEVYLVTGSDVDKTIEQLGLDICNAVKRIYSCSGNEVWQNSYLLRSNNWEPSTSLLAFLESLALESAFSIRSGNHIEIRTGCLNFSVVGRNATFEQRNLYKQWDKASNERTKLVAAINYYFPELSAVVGGETGIDIYPQGCDKSQILKDFKDTSSIYFFGDKTQPGGNDYTITKQLKNVHTVITWEDTWEILLYLQEYSIAAQ